MMMMMTRYERIYNHCEYLRINFPKSLRVCEPIMACSCTGCVGSVNGTRIKKRELEMYMSGEMKEIIDRNDK